MGDFHKQLEKELREYMGTRNIVLFVNRHIALEIVTQALELMGEVVTTPLSFTSITHTIVRNGLTPVFCDIRPEGYTMDPGKVEVLITERTSVIIPVHVYGNLCGVERVEAIARKHGLRMIYDAARASGERYKRKSVIEFGDASTFSFHATKVFNSVEGGAVTFREDWVEHRLDCLKNLRIVGREYVIWVGGNAKMNELQVVMGLCNLHHPDQETDGHRLVAERYLPGLTGVSGIRPPPFRKGLTFNYAHLPVLFEDFKADRDQVYDCLAGYRIYLRKYFYSPINDFQCYKGRFPSRSTPMTTYVADRVLALLYYADLELEDVGRTCGIIRGVQETNVGKVLLVIPAFNEEKSIERVVEDLAGGFPQLDYVVMNDDSRDYTAKICRERGYNLLDLPVNLGLTGCFQAGMKYVYRKERRYVIQSDGNGQHRPEYIEAMKQKMGEGYDVVIGSRSMTERKGRLTGMVGSRVVDSAIRLTTGARVTDPTSGMRMFSQKMIEEFALNLNYGPEPDTVSFLVKQDVGVAELQVAIDEGMEGESYLKPLATVHYTTRILISTLMIQNFRKRQGRLKIAFQLPSGAWRIYEESDETSII